MIKGRDQPREDEGMVLLDRTGEGKTEMLGRIGHRWNQKRWIIDRKLCCLRQCCDTIAAVHVIDPYDICKEKGIETSALQQFRQLNPGLEVGIITHSVVGANPQSR